MLIASSDMTHYEPQRVAKQKDSLAIEAITALDEKRLMETVVKYSISMCVCSRCGYVEGCQDPGAKKAN